MSVRVLAKVWDHFPGGGSELLLLLALADWADDAGRCWPAMSAIGDKCRLSRSQALRVAHKLIDDGFLIVEGNDHGGAPGSTRRYRIAIERLTGSADATGSAHATGSVDATRRVAPMHKTGSAGATQTVSEPSVNRQQVHAAACTPLPRSNEHHESDHQGARISEPVDSCPHQQIIDAYHELLPTCTSVRIWNEQRRKLLRQRWRESEDRQRVEWWRKFFAYVARSEFLTGRAHAPAGRDPFCADLEWLIRPQNFAKVIEGKYHREAA